MIYAINQIEETVKLKLKSFNGRVLDKEYKSGDLLIEILDLDVHKMKELFDSKNIIEYPKNQNEVDNNYKEFQRIILESKNISLLYGNHMDKIISEYISYKNLLFHPQHFTETGEPELPRWDNIIDLDHAELCLFINRIKDIVSYCYIETSSEILNKLSPIERYMVYREKAYHKEFDMGLSLDLDFKNIKIEKNYIFPGYIDHKSSKMLTDLDWVKYFHDENVESSIIDVYNLDLMGLTLFEFVELIKSNKQIKKCNNCSKYFIVRGRKDSLYCDRIYKDSKTCKEIGAISIYREKTKDDELFKEYHKAYKRNYARIKSKKISSADFSKWGEMAREFRDDVLNGTLTLIEFVDWLNSDPIGGVKIGK